jgi:hypothetical protein
MAFDGLQHVAETREDVGPDRLALVAAGHHLRIGVDAEMVRPEPHPAFDKADLRADCSVKSCLCFVEEDLPRHRTCSGCPAIAGGASGCAAISFSMLAFWLPFSASFCAASRRYRASLSFAVRSALDSKKARLATPLLAGRQQRPTQRPADRAPTSARLAHRTRSLRSRRRAARGRTDAVRMQPLACRGPSASSLCEGLRHYLPQLAHVSARSFQMRGGAGPEPKKHGPNSRPQLVTSPASGPARRPFLLTPLPGQDDDGRRRALDVSNKSRMPSGMNRLRIVRTWRSP